MATDLGVTVEDRPGVLAELGAALGNAGVNIEGVSGEAAGSGSVVHLLVADAAGARVRPRGRRIRCHRGARGARPSTSRIAPV